MLGVYKIAVISNAKTGKLQAMTNKEKFNIIYKHFAKPIAYI